MEAPPHENSAHSSPQRRLRRDGNPQEGQELPDAAQVAAGVLPEGIEEGRAAVHSGPGTNCLKIGLPGKRILC